MNNCLHFPYRHRLWIWTRWRVILDLWLALVYIINSCRNIWMSNICWRKNWRWGRCRKVVVIWNWHWIVVVVKWWIWSSVIEIWKIGWGVLEEEVIIVEWVVIQAHLITWCTKARKFKELISDFEVIFCWAEFWEILLNLKQIIFAYLIKISQF